MVRNVCLIFVVTGVVNKFFRDALGSDFVNFVNCEGVKVAARILYLVLDDDLTKERMSLVRNSGDINVSTKVGYAD